MLDSQSDLHAGVKRADENEFRSVAFHPRSAKRACTRCNSQLQCISSRRKLPARSVLATRVLSIPPSRPIVLRPISHANQAVRKMSVTSVVRPARRLTPELYS
jgi:hypothetical protein